MSTLKHKEVTIRKRHRCVGCGDRHEPKEKMIYWVGIFEGDFQANYWCKPCDAYIDKYPDTIDGGITFGDFKGEPHYEQFKIEFLKPIHPLTLKEKQ